MAREILNQDRANYLLHNAAMVYNVNPMGKSRARYNTWSRAAISKVLHQEGHTYKAIGTFINKDHATIHHYLSHHPDNLIYDKEYEMLFNSFIKNINTGSNSKDFLMNSISESVHHSISILKKLGYDWNFIETYLKMCMESSRLKTA